MRIKKFEQINESEETFSESEHKAIDAGYKVGDRVFNKRMQKTLVIVKDSRTVLDDKNDNHCTLGSVGENLSQYRKARTTSHDTHRNEVFKFDLENRLELSIKNLITKGLSTKKDIEKLVDGILKNL